MTPVKRQRAISTPSKRSRSLPKSQQSLLRRPSKSGPSVGFPQKLVIKHIYKDNQALTSTLGVTQRYLFRANGMFDPDFTGTGHQPMYFDQLAALYDHYTVTRSKIKISIVNTTQADGTTPATAGGVVSLCLEDDTTAPTAFLDLIENSTATTKIIGPIQSSPTVLTRAFSAVGQFGPQPLDNDNLQGTGTSDPAEQTTYVLSWTPTGAITASVNFLVEIEYTATWDELKSVAAS